MNDDKDLKASRLDDALSGGGVDRHAPELRPFVQTADALRREAEAPIERLDPVTAKNHKIVLMNMAKAQESKSEIQIPKFETPKPAPKPMFAWIVGTVGVLAVVLVAVLVATQRPVVVPTKPGVPSLARLVIPAAHASDAFTLVAEKTDAAGASSDTSFKITSNVAVSAGEIQQSLRVIPAVPVDVEPIGQQEFRVKPQKTLVPGTVYRIQLAAAVQQDDGTQTGREFSWAIQTKDMFRVFSSVPGDTSSGVPVNTGIEVTMSQTGWEDPKPFFAITPAVEGRFEAHGRSLAFVPAKPLQYGTIYTVTFTKGWKIAGSDLALAADHVIRFETQQLSDVKPAERVVRITPSGSFFESAPGQESFIQTYDHGIENSIKGPIKLTGYALSVDETKTLIRDVNKVPLWAWVTRNRGDAYRAYAKTVAFTADATIESRGSWQKHLRVPAQKAGVYLVKITPTPANDQDKAEDTWFVLQMTNVATYVMSDAKTTMLWVMNMESQRPLTGIRVKGEGADTQTDQDGLARIPTPPSFATSTDNALMILEVGDAGFMSVVPVTRGGSWWGYGYGSWQDAYDKTVSYLYPDRPLYRIKDSVSFFGLVQDRDSRRSEGSLTIQLTRSGYIDYSSWKDKVFVEQRLSPDESGFFKGELAWDALSPGYYQLVVQRDGKTVTSRTIEVRDVVKPAYTLDVIPAKTAIFSGDAIEGQIKATLFDGTPLSGQKLTVSLGGGREDRANIEVTTDDSGLASYRFQTTKRTCNINTRYIYCGSSWSSSVEARPTDAEEAQIFGSAFVTVWAARISTDVETETKGNQATLRFFVRRVDLTKANGREDESVLTDPVPGVKISGRVIERHYERVELPGETYYDFIEKKVHPVIRYVLKERDVQTVVDLTTGPNGRATLNVPMIDGVSYRFVAKAFDETGAEEVITAWFAKGWYDRDIRDSYESGQEHISLEPTRPRDDRPAYKLDEEVSTGFFRGKNKLPDAEQPRFLYVETNRGIRKATVTNRSTHTFRYREELVPNMTLHGVIFGKFGFIEGSYSATFDTGERELTVTVTPDQASYAPGAKVTVAIDVKNPQGNPVNGAKVALGAVDLSLLAASYGGDYDERPLDSLYSWVSDGILTTRSSHGAVSGELGPGGGGAEMGGGGQEAIRRNFKDTAVFEVVTTDAGGRATVSFTAPDNITSWRLMAVAATPNLFAGSARGKVSVTKPVFVDAVIPQTMLAADKPVIKLRAHGIGLTSKEPVTFRVDAPTLGIADQSVTGTAGVPVYVAIDKLIPGTHAMIIRLTASRGTDALERKLNVLPSRFTKDELVSTELFPGTALPDIGTLPEIELSFMSLTQSRYFSRVQDLSYTWSARVESKLAANVAKSLLKNIYAEKEVAEPEPLLNYQRDDGGIAILPYASSDAELSSKVAATAPDAFDRGRLAGYLWQITDNKKVLREESIRALSGLAALGEPVLTRLERVLQEKDLNWRETLALARGLEAAGSREASRGILESLLATSEERDGLIRLTVAEDSRSVMESTAEAAALAASLGHPKAKGLDAYLDKNWASDVLNDLDRAYYLAHIVPTLSAGDSEFKYVAGGGEQTVRLEQGATQSVILTAAEAKAFRATSVSAPVAAVYVRRTPGLPAVVPEVGLKRTYAVDGKTPAELREGEFVTVTLTPTWKENAQDGCYVVRDRLPSGLAPFQSFYYDYYSAPSQWYPNSVESNEISFVTCKNWSPITYRARVVSRGTYLVEPASMQSMDAPSVTALTNEMTVTIK